MSELNFNSVLDLSGMAERARKEAQEEADAAAGADADAFAFEDVDRLNLGH